VRAHARLRRKKKNTGGGRFATDADPQKKTHVVGESCEKGWGKWNEILPLMKRKKKGQRKEFSKKCVPRLGKRAAHLTIKKEEKKRHLLFLEGEGSSAMTNGGRGNTASVHEKGKVARHG